MSQGAGVQCTASSSPTPSTAVIPQWKLDLLHRRKTNNCPKTTGAQQSLTQLKHGNFLFFFLLFLLFVVVFSFLLLVGWLVILHHHTCFASNRQSSHRSWDGIVDLPPTDRLLKVNYMMKLCGKQLLSIYLSIHNFKLVFLLPLTNLCVAQWWVWVGFCPAWLFHASWLVAFCNCWWWCWSMGNLIFGKLIFQLVVVFVFNGTSGGFTICLFTSAYMDLTSCRSIPFS